MTSLDIATETTQLRKSAQDGYFPPKKDGIYIKQNHCVRGLELQQQEEICFQATGLNFKGKDGHSWKYQEGDDIIGVTA